VPGLSRNCRVSAIFLSVGRGGLPLLACVRSRPRTAGVCAPGNHRSQNWKAAPHSDRRRPYWQAVLDRPRHESRIRPQYCADPARAAEVARRDAHPLAHRHGPICFPTMIRGSANAGLLIRYLAAAGMRLRCASSGLTCSPFGSIWMLDSHELGETAAARLVT
jgi:hypothetical protein